MILYNATELQKLLGQKYDAIYYASIRLGIGKPLMTDTGKGPYLWTDTALKELQEYFDALADLRERQKTDNQKFAERCKAAQDKDNAERGKKMQDAINKITKDNAAYSKRVDTEKQLNALEVEKQNARKVVNFGDRQIAMKKIEAKEAELKTKLNGK